MPTSHPTPEARLSQLESSLAKFRQWLRDRMSQQRLKLAAAPNADHPSMDHDRHTAGELQRVAAELVFHDLVPANWLLPEDPETRAQESILAAAFSQDICHGREVPRAS